MVCEKTLRFPFSVFFHKSSVQSSKNAFGTFLNMFRIYWDTKCSTHRTTKGLGSDLSTVDTKHDSSYLQELGAMFEILWSLWDLTTCDENTFREATYVWIFGYEIAQCILMTVHMLLTYCATFSKKYRRSLRGSRYIKILSRQQSSFSTDDSVARSVSQGRSCGGVNLTHNTRRPA